jgi:hypothetical protein
MTFTLHLLTQVRKNTAAITVLETLNIVILTTLTGLLFVVLVHGALNHNCKTISGCEREEDSLFQTSMFNTYIHGDAQIPGVRSPL